MKMPVLVRRLRRDLDRQSGQSLVSAMNNVFTDTKDPRMEGKSRGDRLSERSLSILAEGFKEADSLRNYFDSSRSLKAIDSLMRDGVLQRTDGNAYLNDNGLLNPRGKELVEGAMLGRVANSYEALDKIPHDARGKLEGAIPYVLIAENIGKDWSVTKDTGEAIDLMAEYQNTGKRILRVFFDQIGILDNRTVRERYSDLAKNIFLGMLKNSKKEFVKAFEKYAKQAQKSLEPMYKTLGIKINAEDAKASLLNFEGNGQELEDKLNKMDRKAMLGELAKTYSSGKMRDARRMSNDDLRVHVMEEWAKKAKETKDRGEEKGGDVKDVKKALGNEEIRGDEDGEDKPADDKFQDSGSNALLNQTDVRGQYPPLNPENNKKINFQSAAVNDLSENNTTKAEKDANLFEGIPEERITELEREFTREEAQEILQAYAGRDLPNVLEGVVAQVNTTQAKKLVSGKATGKSYDNGFSVGIHNGTTAQLPNIWKWSVKALEQADEKNQKPDVKIGRYAAAIDIKGKKAFVWMTVKETNNGLRLYSLELFNKEQLRVTLDSKATSRDYPHRSLEEILDALKGPVKDARINDAAAEDKSQEKSRGGLTGSLPDDMRGTAENTAQPINLRNDKRILIGMIPKSSVSAREQTGKIESEKDSNKKSQKFTIKERAEVIKELPEED